MSAPIYKLFMFRNTEAYYQASEAERNEFLGKLMLPFKRSAANDWPCATRIGLRINGRFSASRCSRISKLSRSMRKP